MNILNQGIRQNGNFSNRVSNPYAFQVPSSVIVLWNPFFSHLEPILMNRNKRNPLEWFLPR